MSCRVALGLKVISRLLQIEYVERDRDEESEDDITVVPFQTDDTEMV